MQLSWPMHPPVPAQPCLPTCSRRPACAPLCASSAASIKLQGAKTLHEQQCMPAQSSVHGDLRTASTAQGLT